MTAYLTFGALRDKKITADQVVPVSERAWKAEGSRMFIEPRTPVTMDPASAADLRTAALERLALLAAERKRSR